MSVVKKYVNNVRIANKIDTIGNWSTSELSLFNGEIAIVSCATDDIRLKIGDGNGTAVSELPYISYKPLEGHNY